MGLMDKFKNLFTDEEIIEEDDVDTIEIKEVKKEEEPSKLPTFMREKIEKEEQKEKLKQEKKSLKDETKDSLLEKIETDELELPKLEEKVSFKFPIDFTDNDFVETRSRQSIHQKKQVNDFNNVSSFRADIHEKRVKTEPKVADLYKDKKEKNDVKPKFKATPIISPIYGILDKNYTTDDIEKSSRNNLEDNRHSKSVDFDSVRKKAYGSLSDEIKENLMCENCEYLKEAKECQREKMKREDISYEILDEEENTYQDVTLDEATENYYDYGVPYDKPVDVYQDEVVINDFEDKPKKEIPPVKSRINLLSTLKKSMGDEEQKEDNLELTDDLFNLIDSMYDERNE